MVPRGFIVFITGKISILDPITPSSASGYLPIAMLEVRVSPKVRRALAESLYYNIIDIFRYLIVYCVPKCHFDHVVEIPS